MSFTKYELSSTEWTLISGGYLDITFQNVGQYPMTINFANMALENFSVFAASCSQLTTLDVSTWDTSSAVDFGYFLQDNVSLQALDVSNWNTSLAEDFQVFIKGCSTLTSLDVSNWNTSKVARFRRFADSATSLTNVITEGGTGNPFADSPCTNYIDAFTNTNLNQTSIDNILTRINTANTSGGTFDQSGGSAPSATGEAAIDALRGRGWTVTVTGGY